MKCERSVLNCTSNESQHLTSLTHCVLKGYDKTMTQMQMKSKSVNELVSKRRMFYVIIKYLYRTTTTVWLLS